MGSPEGGIGHVQMKVTLDFRFPAAFAMRRVAIVIAVTAVGEVVINARPPHPFSAIVILHRGLVASALWLDDGNVVHFGFLTLGGTKTGVRAGFRTLLGTTVTVTGGGVGGSLLIPTPRRKLAADRARRRLVREPASAS